MTERTKIFVPAEADLDSVIERIISSRARHIVLSIPKTARVGNLLQNFHILKKEAAENGKELTVESVDERILEFAEANQLEAANPIFRKSRRAMSDIIPQKEKTPLAKPKGEPRPEFASAAAEEEYEKEERNQEEDDLIETEDVDAKDWQKEWPRHKTVKRPWKKIALAAIIAAFSGGGIYAAAAYLPRAEVKITLQKIKVPLDETVEIGKNVTASSAGANVKIAAEVFVKSSRMEKEFPAQGKKYIEEKSSGRVTIYNAYSSEPQILVASTRFETPDGKIFRIQNKVTVPGAKVVEGKIIASSIETEVAADKAGEEYNVGPVERFTIPGLKGSPKYEAFYARSETRMSGGFIGETAVPTKEDLDKARKEMASLLKNELETNLSLSIPSGFKTLPEASSFSLLKSEAKEGESGEKGLFTLTAEAELKTIAFREETLKRTLFEKKRGEMKNEEKELEWNIIYGEPKTDFIKGVMTVSVTGELTVEKKIDQLALRESAANKNEMELKALLFSLPGLDNAKISLWPFWVRKAPNDVDKISIYVE